MNKINCKQQIKNKENLKTKNICKTENQAENTKTGKDYRRLFASFGERKKRASEWND